MPLFFMLDSHATIDYNGIMSNSSGGLSLVVSKAITRPYRCLSQPLMSKFNQVYNMDRSVHDELKECVEDMVSYVCDTYYVSGELAWIVVQALATAKIEQFKGNID